MVTKTIEIYSFPVLEVRSLKSGFGQGWLFGDSANLPHASCLPPSFWCLLIVHGVPWFADASLHSLNLCLHLHRVFSSPDLFFKEHLPFDLGLP